MSRPRSDTPKEHTSIIRAKRKDGWTYVQRVVSVYDPKIKNSRRISTETFTTVQNKFERLTSGSTHDINKKSE